MKLIKSGNSQVSVPVSLTFMLTGVVHARIVAPILEELAKEFDGKLDIYKVNTEEEQELAAVFGIRNIPSILFIPVTGQPQMALGALPKETFVKAFKDVLGVEK